VRIAKIAVTAAALVIAGSVQAAGVGVRAGTTGIGADVAWSLAPTVSARLGYSALNFNKGVSTDTVHYDGKLKLSNFNTFLDFSPLGPFRITGGFVFNSNKYDVHGSPGGGGSIDGTVKSGRSAAPYLGVGYGNVSGMGVNFYADLGVMFQGSPKASLSANCGSLSGAACSSLQSQAAAEQGRIEDKLKHFKYYPVANVGLTIGF
jgi:hypothetical protein